MNLPIYLDYAATTPVDPRITTKIIPYFSEQFGNPHSSDHPFGWQAEESVEIARENIAYLINAKADNIIFTSGATESNNIAIKGLAEYIKNKHAGNATKNHIITNVTEHKCVIESCKSLKSQGCEVTFLPVNNLGKIDLEQLEKSITDSTFLVSIMMVNNEIGNINPIEEIGKICKRHNVIFHCDAAQAFGRIPINVDELNIDLMSISGHKTYAPKGIGALYIRRHKPKIRLNGLFSGGGQERNIRSGTIPVPLAVGLGEAAKISTKEMIDDYKKTHQLTKLFLNEILTIDGVVMHGSDDILPANIITNY
ncbi:MAG: aminotransferase class V-fold PLP-dependent enzyme, partial [Pseudomonadota bacterium]